MYTDYKVGDTFMLVKYNCSEDRDTLRHIVKLGTKFVVQETMLDSKDPYVIADGLCFHLDEIKPCVRG